MYRPRQAARPPAWKMRSASARARAAPGSARGLHACARQSPCAGVRRSQGHPRAAGAFVSLIIADAERYQERRTIASAPGGSTASSDAMGILRAFRTGSHRTSNSKPSTSSLGRPALCSSTPSRPMSSFPSPFAPVPSAGRFRTPNASFARSSSSARTRSLALRVPGPLYE